MHGLITFPIGQDHSRLPREQGTEEQCGLWSQQFWSQSQALPLPKPEGRGRLRAPEIPCPPL